MSKASPNQKEYSKDTQVASFQSDRYNEVQPILAVAEYRKILNDYSTSDNRIKERIQYLATFSRKIIKREIETYAKRKG